MGGDGTARTGYVHVTEGGDGLHLLHAGLIDLRVASRVGDEDMLCLQLRTVAKLILNVFGKHGCEFAAILLPYAHLTVADGDAGL